MFHQVDSFSLMEKNEKVEGLEGHKHVMGSFSIKEWLEHIRMNTKDQQPPVLVSARMNDPHVRLTIMKRMKKSIKKFMGF